MTSARIALATAAIATAVTRAQDAALSRHRILQEVQPNLTGQAEEQVEEEYEEFIRDYAVQNNLTAEELAAFRQRYLKHAAHHASRTSLSSSRATQHFKGMLKTLLMEQLPAVTTKEVEVVNKAGVGWKAEKPTWAQDFTMMDARLLQGYIADDSIPETDFRHAWTNDVVIVDKVNETAERRLSEFPPSFDARQRWPPCAETIGFVRDQGKCGSCWAQATAGSMDGRLCVATKGQFSGPNALVSAGYVTSCYNMKLLFIPINGCNGGNPGWAFEQTRQSFFGGGSPTRSCVPYFGSGDSLNHFDSKGNLQAPPCPSSCTGGGYSRSLNSDKFFTMGIVHKTTDFYTATWLLNVAGSVAMSFEVYKDFMSYSGGYYKPTGGSQKLGGHAVTMIGWDTKDGERYNLCINSWGTKWGEQGLFKILSSSCNIQYYIPDISANQRNLPVPGGPNAPVEYVAKSHVMLARDVTPEDIHHVKLAYIQNGSNLARVVSSSGAAVPPDSLRVVVPVKGIECNSLEAVQRENLCQAVPSEVARTLPYKLGPLHNIHGDPGRVSILPCANSSNGSSAIEEKAAIDFLDRHCDTSADPQTVYLAFTVDAPGNDTDVDAVLQGDDFAGAVQRAVSEAVNLYSPPEVGDVCVVMESGVELHGKHTENSDTTLSNDEMQSSSAWPWWMSLVLGLLPVLIIMASLAVCGGSTSWQKSKSKSAKKSRSIAAIEQKVDPKPQYISIPSAVPAVAAAPVVAAPTWQYQGQPVVMATPMRGSMTALPATRAVAQPLQPPPGSIAQPLQPPLRAIAQPLQPQPMQPITVAPYAYAQGVQMPMRTQPRY